jgi:ubiquinone/menaquinone biosynthesis C-methylase UbiE
MRWFKRLYLWATRRLYHEFAWAYDPVSWLVSLGQWSQWREEALDHVTGIRTLEIGFGTGELLLEMARRGLEVYGLDPSSEMHRVTARKMDQQDVRAPRVRGLAQRMPFPDQEFDALIATFPTPYILDPATLREAARLLRRPDPETGQGGGRLIVVGLYVSPRSKVLRHITRALFGASEEQTLSYYEQIAAAAGLEITVERGLVEAGGLLEVPILIAERASVQ